MGSLAILRLPDASALELARRSRRWDVPSETDARLVIGTLADDAIVLGAFQRAGDAPDQPLPRLRRGSGGAAARIGPGDLWLQLTLARPDALLACTADKLLNRYVRPLLKALTKASNVPAHYFGRDWISAAHRPVALVAFAHDAGSGRCLVEAIVSMRRSFAVADRPAFLGKAPATLDEVARRALNPDALTDEIADAYRALAIEAHEEARAPAGAADEVVTDEPPWSGRREEAIGVIAAGRDRAGKLRLGGELMASRDAVARLEERLAGLSAGASRDDVGAVVDEALSGGVIFGVRSLGSIRDAIVDALV